MLGILLRKTAPLWAVFLCTLGSGLAEDGHLTTKSVEALILEGLKARSWKIAFAESLTAGYGVGRLARQSGISAVLRGGIVSYDNGIKAELLGVNRAEADACEAVSASVAKQMARGICERFGVELGVSTTGFAEAWGEHEPHAFIAVCWPGCPQAQAQRLDLKAWPDRESRRQAVVEQALNTVAEILTSR